MENMKTPLPSRLGLKRHLLINGNYVASPTPSDLQSHSYLTMTFSNKAFDHIYEMRYDVCYAITEKADSTREEHALVRLFYNKVFEHTRQRSELTAQAVEQCWKENDVELKRLFPFLPDLYTGKVSQVSVKEKAGILARSK
jgi:hypothetical protein